MALSLDGKTIAFLVAPEGVEQVELTEPWDTVKRAGGTPELISTADGTIQAFNHLDKGDEFDVDKTVDAIAPGNYDGLVLPGGVANPDYLRTQQGAVDFVADFARSGRPIAVICHGPWTLIEAKAVQGRTITSWPSLQTDLRNAGATWVDEQVVTCDHGPGLLVSSRKPDDLDAFCSTAVAVFAGKQVPIGT